ncbi:MAG: hypothetical protein JWL90_1775 [Chthoniobacteraceae bacterium]|nr:hypothetical protein [Chthoniobacteraceae bacterium]
MPGAGARAVKLRAAAAKDIRSPAERASFDWIAEDESGVRIPNAVGAAVIHVAFSAKAKVAGEENIEREPTAPAVAINAMVGVIGEGTECIELEFGIPKSRLGERCWSFEILVRDLGAGERAAGSRYPDDKTEYGVFHQYLMVVWFGRCWRSSS